MNGLDTSDCFDMPLSLPLNVKRSIPSAAGCTEGTSGFMAIKGVCSFGSDWPSCKSVWPGLESGCATMLISELGSPEISMKLRLFCDYLL